MDVNGGQITQTNGNPVFPGTTFTGPLLAGNVVRSDGTTNLASAGETTGEANVGYVVMAQTGVITQAALTSNPSPLIVIPAQSQITGMQLMVTTQWTTATTTLGIGATAGTSAATAFTGATGVQGSTFGLVTINPGTASGTIPANWDNVSNATFQTGGAVDVQILVTNGATGAGVGTLTVFYLQGINNAS
jgi:hypothetical protein